MYTRFLTASLYGLSGEETWVEVDGDKGLPGISIVGLANQSIKEAKDRVHSAIINSGYSFPVRKITVNLTPANKQKSGSHYDLAIALGILNSEKLIKIKEQEKMINGDIAFLGELTLDGRLNKIDGALPMIISLQQCGVEEIVLPHSNIKEATLLKNIKLYPADNLKEVIDHLSGENMIQPFYPDMSTHLNICGTIPDFIDIRGQEKVKRAAQVAAAGQHGMLMIGPPGVGKTMVGKRIPGIMPALSYKEQLEVTQIYSVAGELSDKRPMITERPFRAPHHSISSIALIGGGVQPKPGEISLAHKGILFLDELPEFSVKSLDMLRQPLEDGYVAITRVNGKTVYPSDFMLVAAMNPCKCGYYGDPVRICVCTESDRKRYVNRVSGPLLDRIDIHINLNRTVYKDMVDSSQLGKSTSELKKGVEIAIGMQLERYGADSSLRNSNIDNDMISKYCKLDNRCNKIMKDAFERWSLSARSYHRILRVARTIADIEGEDTIKEIHLFEALSYRMPDEFKS